jgi:glutamine cyclotransferase
MVFIKHYQKKERNKLKQVYNQRIAGQDSKAILPLMAELLKSFALQFCRSKPLWFRHLVFMIMMSVLPSCSNSSGPAKIEQIKNYTYEIVNTYTHDPNAFTQGLIYYDNNLYEGTGLRGASTLRYVDLETGTALRQRNIGQASVGNYFGEGITIFRDTIYQLTWTSHIGFKYNKDTFDSLGNFSYSTQGWGLTHDGAYLIMSDGTDSIMFINPEDFSVIKVIHVSDSTGPVVRLNELEYINNEIYANIWLSNRIAIISPSDGRVTGWIDLTELVNMVDSLSVPDIDVLNGIAYDKDNDRLFVTGKYWPNLFEINLIEVE